MVKVDVATTAKSAILGLRSVLGIVFDAHYHLYQKDPLGQFLLIDDNQRLSDIIEDWKQSSVFSGPWYLYFKRSLFIPSSNTDKLEGGIPNVSEPEKYSYLSDTLGPQSLAFYESEYNFLRGYYRFPVPQLPRLCALLLHIRRGPLSIDEDAPERHEMAELVHLLCPSYALADFVASHPVVSNPAQSISTPTNPTNHLTPVVDALSCSEMGMRIYDVWLSFEEEKLDPEVAVIEFMAKCRSHPLYGFEFFRARRIHKSVQEVPQSPLSAPYAGLSAPIPTKQSVTLCIGHSGLVLLSNEYALAATPFSFEAIVEWTVNNEGTVFAFCVEDEEFIYISTPHALECSNTLDRYIEARIKQLTEENPDDSLQPRPVVETDAPAKTFGSISRSQPHPYSVYSKRPLGERSSKLDVTSRPSSPRSTTTGIAGNSAFTFAVNSQGTPSSGSALPSPASDKSRSLPGSVPPSHSASAAQSQTPSRVPSAAPSPSVGAASSPNTNANTPTGATAYLAAIGGNKNPNASAATTPRRHTQEQSLFGDTPLPLYSQRPPNATAAHPHLPFPSPYDNGVPPGGVPHPYTTSITPESPHMPPFVGALPHAPSPAYNTTMSPFPMHSPASPHVYSHHHNAPAPPFHPPLSPFSPYAGQRHPGHSTENTTHAYPSAFLSGYPSAIPSGYSGYPSPAPTHPLYAHHSKETREYVEGPNTPHRGIGKKDNAAMSLQSPSLSSPPPLPNKQAEAEPTAAATVEAKKEPTSAEAEHKNEVKADATNASNFGSEQKVLSSEKPETSKSKLAVDESMEEVPKKQVLTETQWKPASEEPPILAKPRSPPPPAQSRSRNRDGIKTLEGSNVKRNPPPPKTIVTPRNPESGNSNEKLEERNDSSNKENDDPEAKKDSNRADANNSSKSPATLTGEYDSSKTTEHEDPLKAIQSTADALASMPVPEHVPFFIIPEFSMTTRLPPMPSKPLDPKKHAFLLENTEQPLLPKLPAMLPPVLNTQSSGNTCTLTSSSAVANSVKSPSTPLRATITARTTPQNSAGSGIYLQPPHQFPSPKHMAHPSGSAFRRDSLHLTTPNSFRLDTPHSKATSTWSPFFSSASTMNGFLFSISTLQSSSSTTTSLAPTPQKGDIDKMQRLRTESEGTAPEEQFAHADAVVPPTSSREHLARTHSFSSTIESIVPGIRESALKEKRIERGKISKDKRRNRRSSSSSSSKAIGRKSKSPLTQPASRRSPLLSDSKQSLSATSHPLSNAATLPVPGTLTHGSELMQSGRNRAVPYGAASNSQPDASTTQVHTTGVLSPSFYEALKTLSNIEPVELRITRDMYETASTVSDIAPINSIPLTSVIPQGYTHSPTASAAIAPSSNMHTATPMVSTPSGTLLPASLTPTNVPSTRVEERGGLYYLSPQKPRVLFQTSDNPITNTSEGTEANTHSHSNASNSNAATSNADLFANIFMEKLASMTLPSTPKTTAIPAALPTNFHVQEPFSSNLATTTTQPDSAILLDELIRKTLQNLNTTSSRNDQPSRIVLTKGITQSLSASTSNSDPDTPYVWRSPGPPENELQGSRHLPPQWEFRKEGSDEFYLHTPTQYRACSHPLKMLPYGWKFTFCKETNRPYYWKYKQMVMKGTIKAGEKMSLSMFHCESIPQIVSWDRPEPPTVNIPPTWTLEVHASGDFYYRNVATGATTWNKPIGNF